MRGGFGIAFDRYRSDVSGSGAANPPYVLNPTLNFGFLQDIQSGGGGALSPSAIFGVDRVGDWAAIYSYSIGVQREFWKDTVIDVSYVGSQSRHLPRTLNLNAQLPGRRSSRRRRTRRGSPAASSRPRSRVCPRHTRRRGWASAASSRWPLDFLRPYQGYGDITYRSFDANSTYHSLQVSLQRRFAKSVTLGVAYTLSKVTTTVSDETTFTHSADPRGYDYALAGFDRTHFFVANYVWDLPKGSRLLGDNWLTRAVFDNWTISGTRPIASGNPAELALSIAGQDAGNRLFGAYTNGNLSGQQPRFFVSGDAQNAPDRDQHRRLQRPGDQRPGAVLAAVPAQSRHQQPRSLDPQELSLRRGGEVPPAVARRDVQFPQPHAVLRRQPDD